MTFRFNAFLFVVVSPLPESEPARDEPTCNEDTERIPEVEEAGTEVAQDVVAADVTLDVASPTQSISFFDSKLEESSKDPSKDTLKDPLKDPERIVDSLPECIRFRHELMLTFRSFLFHLSMVRSKRGDRRSRRRRRRRQRRDAVDALDGRVTQRSGLKIKYKYF